MFGDSKLVRRDTISDIRPIDLRDFVSVMKQGLEDRNPDSCDWGYGNTFSKGPRFEPFKGWVPWEDSEVCENYLSSIEELTKYKVDRDGS